MRQKKHLISVSAPLTVKRLLLMDLLERKHLVPSGDSTQVKVGLLEEVGDKSVHVPI